MSDATVATPPRGLADPAPAGDLRRRRSGRFIVRCKKGIVEDFKRVAIDRHPKEAYAVLFGRWLSEKEVHISDIWYPEDQKRFSTKSHLDADVLVRKAWRQGAEAIAESEGLHLVGEIHSHPYLVASSRLHERDCHPSQTDWRSVAGRKWITGICVVSRSPRHTLCRVTFWPPMPRTKVQLV